MEENLKVGDCVRLKSGGPEMTVNEVFDAKHQLVILGGAKEGTVQCTWFKNGDLKKDFFDSRILDIE